MNTLTILFHCLLTSVSVENSCPFYCFSFESNMYFCPLAAFKISFLLLMFSSLTVMCLGVICFLCILLGVCRASRIFDLMSFHQFWKILVIYLYIASALFSFWDSNYTYVRTFPSVLCVSSTPLCIFYPFCCL